MKTFCKVLVVSFLAGCSLAPEYQRPELPLAGQYEGSVISGESVANIGWWSFFKDPILQELIRMTLSENRTRQIALARIAEARAIVGFVRADQFPFLNISGSAQRRDDGTAIGAIGPFNDFGAFGDLSFEVDLWGKLANATEAQQYQLMSTEYAHRALVITLVSQTAQLYFNLIDLDARVAIAQRTLANRGDATKLIRARFSKGIIPELDVNQAEIEEGDALASLASLERERQVVINALQAISGRTSGPINRASDLGNLLEKVELPVGVPADLLLRRPDLLSAEDAVRSEYARIGVAEAQRLPSISILGSIGLRSGDDSDLFDSDSGSWNVGGSLFSPLIDWGKNKSRVEAQEARAEQFLKNYEETVLRSVEEVDNAVISIETYRTEHQARIAQRKAAANAARLSRARYNDGVAPYLEVLDVERSLFDAELSSSFTFQRYLSSIVQLYKALGGGWEVEESNS